MILNKILKKLFGVNKPYVEYAKPLLSNDGYLDLHENAKKEKYDEISNIENRLGFAIDKDFFENLALHLQVVKKKSRLNYQHGRILYSFMRDYLSNNNDDYINVFETGTARGFSSLCLSKAINDSNRNGTIITLDVIPHQTKLYWNCIDDNEGKKTRAELISYWAKEIENIIFLEGSTVELIKKLHIERINFSFLDAQHEEYEVMHEYNYVKERQIKGDMIIFDDYTPGIFNGVVNAISKIKNENLYNLEIINKNSQRGYVIAIKR